MRVAFYKGTRPGLESIFNYLTRWWLRGPYSHCEVIFSDGWSASSFFLDGGVRFKYIEYNPDHWDIVEVNHSEQKARDWFVKHNKQKYDTFGLLGFVFRIIGGHPKRWVYSEAVMEAFGYQDSWRYDPCVMFSTLKNRN